MKRVKRRMAGIILIVMLLTILLSPGSFSAWADKTDDAVDDEFDISAIIDNGDDVIVVPAEDSADPIVPDENITDEESPYKVGDIIKFGKYEQDGIVENGKEDIEWQVLHVESDKVLVLSKYALDCRQYNEESGDVTWETCSLRSWLNGDFKNEAFTSEEQAQIPTVKIVNEGNPLFGTEGGNDTYDQIFCLSVNEVKNFIGYSWCNDIFQCGFNRNLATTPTQYAVDNGAYVFTMTDSDCDVYSKEIEYASELVGISSTDWWLRTPGYDGEDACNVNYLGGAGANYYFDALYGGRAVRPAFYLDISGLLPGMGENVNDPIAMPVEDDEDRPDLEDIIEDVIVDEEEKEESSEDNEDSEDEAGDSEPASEDLGPGEDNSEDVKPGEDNSEKVEPKEDSSEDDESGEDNSEDVPSGEEDSEDEEPGEDNSEDVKPGEENSEDMENDSETSADE